MTEEENAELGFIRMMTKDTHKFAIAIDYPLPPIHQQALEQLMLRDWIRLIDVTVISENSGQLVRVFRVMPAAVEWFKGRTGSII